MNADGARDEATATLADEPPAGGPAPDGEALPTDAEAPPDGEALLADPEAYDSPRGVQARARGLAAPYIAGGEDPDMDRARREERRNLRILIAMVVVIVLSGFVLGYLANLLGI
jgi:hypothetical protein